MFFGVDHSTPLGPLVFALEFGTTIAALVAYAFKGGRSSWLGNAWAILSIAGNVAALAWYVWIMLHIPSF